MGSGAAGRQHHGVDGKAPFGGLIEEFPGPDDVAQCAQGRMFPRQVDDIWVAPIGTDLIGDIVQRLVGGGFVLAFGEVMDGRAQQPVQQNVA